VFAGLINQAKSAASGLVLKYVARASVAVPFIIALGFALAAITVMLVERFGHVTGYWLVAGGLAAIGIVAAITVSVKEHEEEVAEQQAEQSDNEAVSDATAQAMMQVPLALLGAVFTMPGGATSALKVARILGRNYPLVLLLVLIGALFWPTETKAEEAVARAEGAEQKPNGFQPAETLH
jgi:Na+/melibiose symporter-like transporter